MRSPNYESASQPYSYWKGGGYTVQYFNLSDDRIFFLSAALLSLRRKKTDFQTGAEILFYFFSSIKWKSSGIYNTPVLVTPLYIFVFELSQLVLISCYTLYPDNKLIRNTYFTQIYFCIPEIFKTKVSN